MQTEQPYTILRIKRKRNEEPLDALVVEDTARRKKSRPAGVFKFAQTVEDEAWKDQKIQQQIQAEVSRLASAPEQPPAPAVPPVNGRRVSNDFSRRYTILEQDSESKTMRAPTSPPKVVSAKDKAQSTAKFAMFDAVPEREESAAMDAEMENIMPLLKAYLSVSEPTLDPAIEKDDDYVWDVFYHRPATLSEWNSAATVGTLTGLPPSLTDPYDSDSESEVEDEADEDSNAEEYYANDYPEDEDSSDWGSSDEFHENSDDNYNSD